MNLALSLTVSLGLFALLFTGCASSPPKPTAGLVDRAAAYTSRGYEKMVGSRLTDVQLVRFESTVPGAMKWTAADPTVSGRLVRLPIKVLAEFPPGWVVVVTVQDALDPDALARSVLSSLRTTSSPECFWPLHREMMKAVGQERAGVQLRQEFRAAADRGNPQSLMMGTADGLIVFNNDPRPGTWPCYTVKIPGEWMPGGEPGFYVTKNGRTGIGVGFLSPEQLAREGP